MSERERALEDALRNLITYAKYRQSDCTGCCGPQASVNRLEKLNAWDEPIKQAVTALGEERPKTPIIGRRF